MKRVLLVVAVLLAVPVAAMAASPQVMTAAVLIHYRAHDGRVRPAWLLLPAGYHGQRVPLIISPHGRGVSARRNTAFWGNLPTEGDFAVVCPAGQGRRLEDYSWGDPGQIADLARMPEIVKTYGVNVNLHRVYAFGGSMGGQESLLLAAEYPQVLAGVAAFDPATDMSRRYRDFASLKNGGFLRRLARVEIGGTPTTDPSAYALRSPDHYAEQLAFSNVPLQIYWSVRDQIITDQRYEAGALADRIRDLNPDVRLWDFRGDWRHTAEMWPDRRMPRALARFGLLPWSMVPPLRGTEVTRGPGLLA
jgi:pimeloyl-ACP methyl ester carboxylesterase